MIKNVLPADSRVWIYQSVRKFSPIETDEIQTKIKHFVSEWTSHKEGVIADGAILYNRFVVLMADENVTGVSGCSIDSLIHFIKSLESKFSTNFFDRWNIAYITGGEVFTCNISDFRKLIEQGKVSDDTIVFNNLVRSKKDFETKWEIAYKNSWLKNLESVHPSFGSLL